MVGCVAGPAMAGKRASAVRERSPTSRITHPEAQEDQDPSSNQENLTVLWCSWSPW